MSFEVIQFEHFRFVYIFAPHFDLSLIPVKRKIVDQWLLCRHILTNQIFWKFLAKIHFGEKFPKFISNTRNQVYKTHSNTQGDCWIW